MPLKRGQAPDALRQARLRATSNATLASHTPLVAFSAPLRSVAIEGRPAKSGQGSPGGAFAQIGLRYFETLGIPLLTGRAFAERDGAPGREVAIVNQRFAAIYFPGDNPIAKRIQLAAATAAAPATPWLTIVGLAETVPNLGPARSRDLAEPLVYAPLALDPSPRTVVLIARSQTTLATTVSAVREEVRALDADLPLFGVEPLEVAIARATTSWPPGLRSSRSSR